MFILHDKGLQIKGILSLFYTYKIKKLKLSKKTWFIKWCDRNLVKYL